MSKVMILYLAVLLCATLNGSASHSLYDFLRGCNPFQRLICNSMTCPQVYTPVCGSDRVTYNNQCYIKVANCLRGNKGVPITKIFDGKCTDRPIDDKKCDRLCIEIYEPVCASDNKTYSNGCYLSRAICRSPSLSMAYKEECRKSSECDRIACTKDYRPVCGSDGRTYGNRCTLSVGDCRAQESGSRVTEAYVGECRCNEACTFDYNPVCGSDGKTYSNGCTLSVANCLAKAKGSEVEITQAYAGECRCNDACITLYDPVCGSDGVTYSNSCNLGIASCRSRREGGPAISQAFAGSCSDAQ